MVSKPNWHHFLPFLYKLGLSAISFVFPVSFDFDKKRLLEHCAIFWSDVEVHVLKKEQLPWNIRIFRKHNSYIRNTEYSFSGKLSFFGTVF